MSSGWLGLRDLIAVLDDEHSGTALRRYFAPGAFTGSQFEALGGSPKALHRDAVVAEDLIAVELLNARVPPGVALDLLQGDLGQRISDELRKIPIGVDLSDESARTYIEDGGPAELAWRLLTNRHGVNKAIAGKLLARKRPRLIPVYDSVVACALRGRPGFWLWLHEQLRAEDLLMTRMLRKLRVEGDVPTHVSDIRIFDIVFWMRHRGDHRSRGCPGLPNVGPSL
ncbi:DUF6308 family protein [Micromonospora narathiwatensis]|uniref:Uncharacterized protein n=1 Tax=Micromonospora narathiwatensis TaxID=299146 RepID=A0A1A8ZKY8_9ACTN|nr:DUF6308 family protein [Micromonospora narathiwatensis]SBT44558.1 hypothetical protein GA0070621_2097 [Micromonospora narathiwatensis]